MLDTRIVTGRVKSMSGLNNAKWANNEVLDNVLEALDKMDRIAAETRKLGKVASMGRETVDMPPHTISAVLARPKTLSLRPSRYGRLGSGATFRFPVLEPWARPSGPRHRQIPWHPRLAGLFFWVFSKVGGGSRAASSDLAAGKLAQMAV